MKFALENTDLPQERIDYCIGTGYGRVNVPMADKTVTEIACHARGANFIYGPQVRTVLDVGGQDIKAIRCDDKGRVTNFLRMISALQEPVVAWKYLQICFLYQCRSG